MRSIRTLGAYATGETGTALLPRFWKGDGSKPGVILLHGATEDDAFDWLTRPQTGNPLAALAAAIADAGFPCFAPYAAGDAFANDTALARVSDARTYLQGTLGAKAGKVAIIGSSMGGGTAYAWTRANPTLVSCLVPIQPLSDLNDVVVNNRGGVAALVNTAYGGAYSNTTHGPTHNPESFKAQLAGVVAQVWYSTTDLLAIPATVTSVTTAIGASADVHAVTGQHGFGMAANIDVPTLLAFLRANA